MKNKRKILKRGWAAVAVALFALIFLVAAIPAPVTAKAASQPCTVHYYKVNAVVREDRTIEFEEEISFTMHVSKNSFYRSLPLEGDRYFNIKAASPNNEAFSYEIADNPDVDGFMDINCYGGVEAGKTLTYQFSYTMEVAEKEPDGMIIDFIGAGWPIALKNVSVHIEFPAPVENYTVYSGRFGEAENRYVTVVQSGDKTVMKLTADELPLVRTSYGDDMAAAITLDFSFREGVLQSYTTTRLAKPTLWVVLGCCVACLAAVFLLLWKCSKKPILVPVVGFRPPEGMDPMAMGKFIDGAVENEDVTSMIFYFASEGYLTIGLNGDDPVLTRTGKPFPDDAPAYQKTLFYGLFKIGKSVEISELKNKYYESIDAAKMQLATKSKPRYEKKSVVFTLLGGVLALAAFFLPTVLIGLLFVGGGYLYPATLVMAVPVFAIVLFGYLRETRRHKGKGAKSWTTLLSVVAMIIGGFIFLFIGSHLFTEIEKIFMLITGCVAAYLAPRALTVTEEHNDLLAHVVGFKEFITVTEQDKIKFMLEENPELFYDILPYAQVLGVTDEWEDKFKDITISSPSWYEGSYVDYWIMRSCMRRATVALVSRPQSNGSSVGRSGGGGSFGGFSGGGRGGGGGGFR